MHLARLKDDPRRRRARHLARLAQQRPQQVDGVEVAEEVDAEVAVDAVGVELELVGVDAGREREVVEPVERLGELGEDVADHGEAAEVALLPLDLGAGRLLLDLGDGRVALLFLAVDHDDAAAGVGEGSADLVADSQGAAGDDGYLPVEVGGMDLLGSDDLVENGLHGGWSSVDVV
jgi:hypothetical protein